MEIIVRYKLLQIYLIICSICRSEERFYLKNAGLRKIWGCGTITSVKTSNSKCIIRGS